MNIRIKKNDYVQPTEVRESVVQDICDIMLDYTDKSLSMTVFAKDNAMYLATMKSGSYKTIAHQTSNVTYDYERIHSCEMDAAFKAFQDAGYHIYADKDKKTRNTTYRFSKKPVMWGIQSKTVEFDMFID
jgi:hypothetical protein